jgi:hypothetical protein
MNYKFFDFLNGFINNNFNSYKGRKKFSINKILEI